MDKNKKALFIIFGILAAGGIFVIVNSMINKSSPVATQTSLIDNIMKHVIDSPTQADYERLLSYDQGYLKAWSDAINASAKSFTYNSKNYDTASGTAIV